MMIHILIGTRAQLIKMIPVMHKLKANGIQYNFIFMAQHHETIYQILEDFDLKKPDYVLCDVGKDIVSAKQMVFWSIKVLFQGLKEKKKIFCGDKTGIVLIHGDAPPLFLGAIIAKFQGLKVGSIEAGLRSYNFFKPFPEEITRVVTAKLRLINVFYCQDSNAMTNVKSYHGRAVHTQGNTILDTIALANKINQVSRVKNSKQTDLYCVVTLHRFETISNMTQLKMTISLIEKISKKIFIKFILHPPTRTALIKYDLYHLLDANPNIELLPRMSFIEFNSLISPSEFIVSDGGSNQEESAYLGIPCLLFRNETERFEGLGENVVLSKFDENVITEFLEKYRDYKRDPKEATKSPTDIIINDILPFC